MESLNSGKKSDNSITINTVASGWPKQGSMAVRKMNKKMDEELLEITTNFVAEKGVTYKNSKGMVTSKG